MAAITADILWRLLVSSSIVILGFPLIFYVPQLLRLFFRRLLHLEVEYKSPVQCYREHRSSDRRDDDLWFDTQKRRDFYGYYNQKYFKLSPTARYLRTNVFVLFYIFVKVLIVVCLLLAVVWVMDADLTVVITSVTVPTAIALFHLSDYMRGFFTYVWLVWSNKVKLGDEIDMENARGVVTDLGPLVTIIYVFMQGVPLIGSVQTVTDTPTASPGGGGGRNNDHNQTARESSLLYPPNHHHHPHTYNHIPSPGTVVIPLSVTPPKVTSAADYLRNQNVEVIQHGPNVYHALPTVMTNRNDGSITANPQSLRYFTNAERRRHPGDSPPPAQHGHSLVADEGSRRITMNRVGYVALPLDSHHFRSVPTYNFLLTSYKHFDYDVIDETDDDNGGGNNTQGKDMTADLSSDKDL